MIDTGRLTKLAADNPRTSYFIAFACGALTMLSFAPFGWFVVAPLLLAPFLFACVYLGRRQATRMGFAYGAGLFLAGTYWLYTSIHVFGKAPLWIAIFIMVTLVLIMAFYYGLTAWLVHRLLEDRPKLLIVIAPAAFVFFEWVRGWFMSGFPWMTLGYGQIDSPLAAFAPMLGAYGISLLLLISSVALFLAVTTSEKRAAWLVVFVVPWIAGFATQNLEWSEPGGEPLTTTIVQGGVSQDRKWLREQFWPTMNMYRASLDTHADSDLVLWPEVALPAIDYFIGDYLDEVEQVAAAQEQTLLLGVLESVGPDNPVYNSILKLDGGDRQYYRKQHLVPFGEYFPVPDFVRSWMRMMSLPNSDLAAGEARQPLVTMRDGTPLSIAICYEDAYASELLYAFPDASIMINVSNDAWFGDSIAPHQHLEIARMRAKEVARYVVRSTNNGISAFIGPDGSVLEQGPQFEYVAMTREITPMVGATPFARFGNWPVVLLCFSVLLTMGARVWVPLGPANR